MIGTRLEQHLFWPEFAKWGPKGTKKWAKKSENCLLATQIRPEGTFWIGRGGTRLEHKRGPPGIHQNSWCWGLFSIFIIFGPILAFFCYFKSPWSKFVTTLTWKKGPNWSCRMPPTQNRLFGPTHGVKRLLSVNFGHFLDPLGQHLGYFGPGKWAKLVSLDVFSAVPTLFQHSSIQ